MGYIRSLLILYIAGYGLAFLIGAVQKVIKNIEDIPDNALAYFTPTVLTGVIITSQYVITYLRSHHGLGSFTLGSFVQKSAIGILYYTAVVIPSFLAIELGEHIISDISNIITSNGAHNDSQVVGTYEEQNSIQLFGEENHQLV